jgi:ABC-type lipoprotein export system ATPase subunit
MLQSINKGKVAVENERFYLKSGNQAKMEFNLVAEGMRKIALLWQLIKNGTLERGSVLFWDEPEANINPKYIPVLADILLELQREGVQIFIATHDYFLAKYIETRKKENDIVTYLSLYLREDTKQIAVEQNDSFAALEHNTILETFMELYHEEVRKAME